MKKKWKVVIAIIVILTFFLAAIYLVGSYSSGSFGYAQQYQFNVNKIELIKAVERFKNENNSFNPPSIYLTRDSLDTYTSNFNVYVYYPNQNSIVYFFIDNQDRKTSNINLVSINEGLTNPYYKRVNKDFDREHNLKIKEEFKERVLNKLGLSYEDKGNGMFIFWK